MQRVLHWLLAGGIEVEGLAVVKYKKLMLTLSFVAVFAVSLECGSCAYEDGFDEGAFELLEADVKSGWKCELRDGSWFKFGVHKYGKAPCAGMLYLVRSDGRRFKALCGLVKPHSLCERAIMYTTCHEYDSLSNVDFDACVYQLLCATQIEEK